MKIFTEIRRSIIHPNITVCSVLWILDGSMLTWKLTVKGTLVFLESRLQYTIFENVSSNKCKSITTARGKFSFQYRLTSVTVPVPKPDSVNYLRIVIEPSSQIPSSQSNLVIHAACSRVLRNCLLRRQYESKESNINYNFELTEQCKEVDQWYGPYCWFFIAEQMETEAYRAINRRNF